MFTGPLNKSDILDLFHRKVNALHLDLSGFLFILKNILQFHPLHKVKSTLIVPVCVCTKTFSRCFACFLSKWREHHIYGVCEWFLEQADIVSNAAYIAVTRLCSTEIGPFYHPCQHQLAQLSGNLLAPGTCLTGTAASQAGNAWRQLVLNIAFCALQLASPRFLPKLAFWGRKFGCSTVYFPGSKIADDILANKESPKITSECLVIFQLVGVSIALLSVRQRRQSVGVHSMYIACGRFRGRYMGSFYWDKGRILSCLRFAGDIFLLSAS